MGVMAIIGRTFAAIALLVCGACTTLPPAHNEPAPQARPPKAPAQLAADEATRMVGMRYRFGGATPQSGFDCSGLVHYSFVRAGMRVPRTTEEQLRASRPVRPSELRPGDLLFFDERGKKNGHVAIYLGDLVFVHAPSSGKRVRRDRLDSPFWSRQLSDIRRL